MSGRDLSLHDLSDIHFTDFHFEDAQFGKLRNVEFAGCTFANCEFVGSSVAHPTYRGGGELENVVFYQCELRNTHFERCRLSDVQIAKCRFDAPVRFTESKVQRTLKILESGDANTLQNLPDLEMRAAWNDTLVTDVTVRPAFGLDWAAIRTLAQLPFLQISLVGLTLLVAQIFVVDLLFSLARWPEQSCREIQTILAQYAPPELHSKLGLVCNRLDRVALLQSVGSSLIEAVALFALLFAAALIHKIASPSEILEYSYNQWRIDNQRLGLSYRMLAQRRRRWLCITLVLYTLATCIFLHLLGSKLVAIIDVLSKAL
ncbi:MAG: pentapeptide repeat-containing protein [Enhydrobacter sp.]|nr:MAG: pentapeptide repeat-containing protein [Enhydrobacter sp.]